jgi:hypothetical protein
VSIRGSRTQLPLNLWITSIPSTILILESAEVTSTSDGLLGENYEDAKSVSMHYWHKAILGDKKSNKL